MFAPPTEQERSNLFAPPSPEELSGTQPEKLPEPSAPEFLSDEDYKRIADKHGVDPSELRQLAPYYGVSSKVDSLGESIKEGAKYTAGFAGRAVGLGIPQFLYKKAQSQPMREALDELTDVGQKQRSLVETASEFVAPGGAIGQASKRTAVRLAGTTGTGAVVGAAASREGEELSGATTGAALGLGLGAAGETLAKVAARRGAGPVEVEALMEAQPRNMQFNITDELEKVAQQTAKSDADMGRMIMSGELPNTFDEAERIIREQMDPQEAVRLLDINTQEGSEMARRVIKSSPELATELGTSRASIVEAARDIVERRAQDFAEQELRIARPKNYEDAVAAIREYGKRQGPEYLQAKYQDFTRGLAAEQAVTEQGLRAMPETALGKISNKISGVQFVLRNFDDQYGTLAERALATLNRGTNKMTYPRATFRRRLDEIYQQARKTGVDPVIRDTDTILRAIEAGEVSNLPVPQQQIANEVSNYFASIRNFANKVATRLDPVVQRLGIPKLENYVTRVAMETSDLVPQVERALETANAAAEKLFGKQLRQLSLHELDQLAKQEADVKNLVEFMNWKNSGKTIPQSGAALVGQVKDALYSDSAIATLEKASRATMERVGQIPDFIREKNLYKVMDRYAKDVLDTLYKRRGLDALRVEMRKLKAAGADTAAKYIENVITDTLGSRKNTAARVFSNIKTEMARKLNHRIEKAEGTEKLALRTAKELIHLPAYLNRSIYGNVLGWFNPRPIIQNLVSGIGRTAPELGNRYGAYTYMRGLASVVQQYRKTGKLSSHTSKAGLTPAEFTRQGERALADGLRSTGLFARGADALEGASKVGMSLYRLSEDVNRAAIYETARVMARDLINGSKMAQQSLTRFPYSIRKEVIRAGKDQDQIHKILAGHLNDVTAFNYNRSSMFELGRDLGPIFSTFAKWPTEVMGEAIYELRSKGALRGMGANARRMLPILATFASFDFLMNHYADTEESDTYKKFMGKMGLKSAAPVNSLAGFVSGEIFTPPAIDAVMRGIINPIASGDIPRIEKGVENLATQYVPGAGFIKLITDDIPTYITGTRPEGSGIVERAEAGIEKLTK